MAVTVTEVRDRPRDATPLVAVTAYDRPTGLAADRSGAEIVLVGDSLANVLLGKRHTVEIGLPEMLHHVRAARVGVEHALLVADLPFGAAQAGVEAGAAAAVELVRAGAQAVKLEGGSEVLDLVRHLTAHGIAVMGHLGLTPQKVHGLGGYRVQGRSPEAARRILEDARSLEEAGAFSLVLEYVPAPLADRVTAGLSVPTIGIGSGPGCRGQILVFHDAVGWEFTPFRHLRKPFGEVGSAIDRALAAYASAVREGDFPSSEESWTLDDETLAALDAD